MSGIPKIPSLPGLDAFAGFVSTTASAAPLQQTAASRPADLLAAQTKQADGRDDAAAG